MTFNTDWDIEQYKTKFECDEHWALKRDFMLAHKDSFSEERLVCLAQLFVNIELLRCTYPKKVMKQVSILAKEIGHDYKERQKKRLQRTFVKASDAANAKARGDKRSYAQANKDTLPEEDVVSAHKRKHILWLPDSESPVASFEKSAASISSNVSTNRYINLVKKDNQSKEMIISPRMKAMKQKITCTPLNNAPETIQSLLDNNNPLSKIILLTFGYDNRTSGKYNIILRSSIGFSKMCLVDKYQQTPTGMICRLYTDNNLFLGTGTGCGKKDAIEDAAKNALEKLLKVCICIKILKVSSSDGEVSLDQLGLKETNGEVTESEKLSDTNVGAKLMKLMGWSGGALGKTGIGITEPIKESTVIGRSGLGLGKEQGVTQQFINTVRKLIRDYMSKEGVQDLVFSSDLSNIQRKAIHEQAFKVGMKQLKSCSHGKGDNRFLVVSWKMNNEDALQSVLDQGGKTDRYELFKPNTITVDDL